MLTCAKEIFLRSGSAGVSSSARAGSRRGDTAVMPSRIRAEGIVLDVVPAEPSAEFEPSTWALIGELYKEHDLDVESAKAVDGGADGSDAVT